MLRAANSTGGTSAGRERLIASYLLHCVQIGTHGQAAARKCAIVKWSDCRSLSEVAIDAASGERRIRALEDAHELIATQRDRIARLRERLTASPRIDLARRSAA